VLGSDNSMADLVIRLTPQDIQGTLSDMEAVWKTIAPEVPFTYSFLDDDLARLYLEEERWVQVIQLASILALTIAYLGLFGLITLTLAARKREISIRKVLGAGFWSLTRTLSLGFLRMIGLAALLAAPLAWYFSNRWLDAFAFKVAFQPKTFLIAVGLLVGAFALTMSYHLWKSQRLNPSATLKQE